MGHQMPNEADSLFDECLPPHMQTAVSVAMTRAYVATEHIIDSHPLLYGDLHSDIRPHIRRIAVDICLKELATAESGFRAVLQFNKAKNCRHVELHAKRLLITASYVESKKQLPRKAAFRQARSACHNMSLFAAEPINSLPLHPYAHLLHGSIGKKIDFLLFTIPDITGKFSILSRALEISPPEQAAPIEEIKDEVLKFLTIQQNDKLTGSI